jgi:DNA-binding SARP family transcriptional activator
MAEFSIYLLGKLSIHRSRGQSDILFPQKAQELLSYLIIRHKLPHPREKLAGVLWGDVTVAKSKTYLRKALWQLHSVIERIPGSPQSNLLLVTPEYIQLNPSADLWVDVQAFEQIIDRVRGRPGQVLASCEAELLHQATELYQGDLLDGWYHEWCLHERERLQNTYLAILDKLMAYCEKHMECERGLHYGTEVLRYDRAHERTYRRLMRLHALNGDRTAALRQFERCRAALREELGVNPTTNTVALLDKIRNDQLTADLWPMPDEPEETDSAQLSDVICHLRQISQTLADIQRRVQYEIRRAEQAVRV